jgi:hypothetical protein
MLHDSHGTLPAPAAHPKPHGSSDYAIGVLLILCGTTVTSLAGVYSEWVLKRSNELPFFLQVRGWAGAWAGARAGGRAGGRVEGWTRA